ncbi:hybrid sensor histidine kinase/response regulator [Noviherbaspirillum humi]|nr:ATP-binding protein [Noviherbaspirillum humi]
MRLSTQLALLLAGSILVLTLALTALVGRLATEKVKADIGARFADLSFQAVDKIGRSLSERQREFELLAARPDFAEPGVSAETKRRYLESLQKNYPHYAWIGMTDNDGKVMVAANGILEGTNVASRPWFVRAMQGLHLTDVHQAVLLQKLLQPGYGDEPMRFIDLTFPYRDREGRMAGILGAHLSMKWAEEIERSILLPALRRQGIETIVLDKDYSVVLGPPELMNLTLSFPALSAAAEPQTGYAIQRIASANEYLLGYSKSSAAAGHPSLGWTVVVRQDLKAAYAPVRQLQQQIMAIGLAVAVLFAALGAFLSGRISRPLRLLTEAAHRVQAGEDSRISKPKGGYAEIHVLHRSLQTLLEKLQEKEAAMLAADRRKDEFIATLAHELRNPLAPMQSGLELMRLSGNSPAVVARVQTVMDRQLGTMVHLINDLLDVSRITRGKVQLRKERISLRQVLESAIETARPLIESRRHALDLRLPAHDICIEGDQARLAQVVGNLLNNAAKYTPEHGRIALEACQDGDDAVISVADDGIGIAQESLPAIFEMFNQVGKTQDSSYGGLGIGLNLVRQLVELHGGTATAASAGIGRGSTFVIRLPAGPNARSAAQPEAALPVPMQAIESAAPAVTLRILVVDDNSDAAQNLAALLEALGHETSIAADGRQALEAVPRFRPDIIFSDIGMPVMNGYEFARTMTATPASRRTVLVAVTGWGSERDRLRATEAGFDYHLTKPAQLADIRRILQEAFPAGEDGARDRAA